MDIDKMAADIAASVEQEPTDWTRKLIRFGIEAGLEQAAVIAKRWGDRERGPSCDDSPYKDSHRHASAVATCIEDEIRSAKP
mgnify:CR=1 FL=1